VICKTCRKYGS